MKMRHSQKGEWVLGSNLLLARQTLGREWRTLLEAVPRFIQPVGKEGEVIKK